MAITHTFFTSIAARQFSRRITPYCRRLPLTFSFLLSGPSPKDSRKNMVSCTLSYAAAVLAWTSLVSAHACRSLC